MLSAVVCSELCYILTLNSNISSFIRKLLHESRFLFNCITFSCRTMNMESSDIADWVLSAILPDQSANASAQRNGSISAVHTALTSLDLTKCTGVTNNGLQVLANLTTLASLDISLGGQVTDGLRHLASLTTLTELNLRNCFEITNDGLKALNGLTSLTRLAFATSDRLTDNGYRTLTNFIGLTDLTIHGYRNNRNNSAMTSTYCYYTPPHSPTYLLSALRPLLSSAPTASVAPTTVTHQHTHHHHISLHTYH
jgi:hypothetical protein